MSSTTSERSDRHILRRVLLINAGQCVVGAAVGIWASSTALIGTALDNLADASVYAVSLYAVGRAARIKIGAARLSGWLLIGLAVSETKFRTNAALNLELSDSRCAAGSNANAGGP